MNQGLVKAQLADVIQAALNDLSIPIQEGNPGFQG